MARREDRDTVRSITFRFRISPAEDRRFHELARNRGVKRAELIREVLGLEAPPDSPAPLPPAAVGSAARPDPKSEPGASAVLEIADRIQRKIEKGAKKK